MYMVLLLFFIWFDFRPEEMIVYKRKEMFHRILWMKRMTTYRFVNPQLLNALPELLQKFQEIVEKRDGFQ